MTTISQNATVPFTARQLFDLVNHIEQYPEFLPGCSDTKILSKTAEEIQATIFFSKGILRKSFSTVNRLIPDSRIEMRLLQGPFRYLEGAWQFNPTQEGGCEIAFNLSFEFSNKLFALALGPLFQQMTHSLVQVFIRRAYQVYG